MIVFLLAMLFQAITIIAKSFSKFKISWKEKKLNQILYSYFL